MDDAADEDYDLDYDDDDDDVEDEEDIDVENMYYQAKGQVEDDPEEALSTFREIVEQEEEKGDWGFKALKQMTKLLYCTLDRPEDALETYTELLAYTKSAVTRNYSEKSINNILEYVGGEGKGQGVQTNLQTLEKFYEVTKKSLEESKNERLSVKANLKLAKLWLERKEWDRMKLVLTDLHAFCVPSSSSSGTSSEDQSKGTILLEVYALEIQMYSELKDYRKLKEIYRACLQVRSAIPHPRIMGVIRECGGKMWMGEKNWAQASTDFFESFKQFDESGSPQRIQVLKYLVLAYMLMGSEINPFDSQETKPYKNDPEIVAMTNLVAAYQRRDIHDAQKILRENKATILDDPFIKAYIDDVLRSLRTQYLLDLIKPYTRMELRWLGRQLNVSSEEVEDLLVGLILDGKVKGTIDQVLGRLELDRGHAVEKALYKNLSSWSSNIQDIQTTVLGKHALGGPPTEGSGLNRANVPFFMSS
ncbi:COP9 signalosome, subunit CSN2 [Phaffia rhodozyma]|uniref:COP9 signalosome complex subunit 2 n=1 Tax=Phaffia rhodozyma TaxID=264483 RepID=A0A0F7SEI1_PHARH|nr:COP9 signalosome, subunit CSN2 [Phaffia rhodozyma]